MRKGLLVYVGANYGETLINIVHRYQRVIAFECNPILYHATKVRFKKFDNFEIYPFAAATSFATVRIHLPNNQNYFGSASILNFSDSSAIKSVANFEAISVDLGVFLKWIRVENIDLYVSDIEGMDYAALTSMADYIREGRVKSIQCEVWPEGFSNPFKKSKEKNYEKDFDELLSNNYRKVAEGVPDLKRLKWEPPVLGTAKDVLWELKTLSKNSEF